MTQYAHLVTRLAAMAAATLTAFCAFAEAAPSEPEAGKFKVVAHFSGGAEGRFLSGELTVGADGALYGVMMTEGSQDCGTIVRIRSPEGITVVHDFGNGEEGCGPTGPLLLGSDGHMYGTTMLGGPLNRGVIYRFDTDGVYAVVAGFQGAPNGRWPLGALIEGQDGLIYGTAQDGGENNLGTIFSVSRGGQIELVHSFRTRDGKAPFGQLVQLDDGTLMGATNAGGKGYGVIFKNDRHGGHVVVHSFAAKKDGAYPNSGLTFGADGKLYGSAGTAGKYGHGVLYRIDSDGENFEVVHHCRLETGYGPRGRLILGQDGHLLGTMSVGGGDSGGVVYSIDSAGAYRVLHRMLDADKGTWPSAGLTDDGAGFVYGVNSSDGKFSRGTSFRLAYP